MKITVLTGAGISAESGIKTFRDSNGLWEEHDVMEVASIQGWYNNQKLVLDFYNARRKQLHEVSPNPAHTALADLESAHEVVIVTQNVDDLHERGGSSDIIHLHGELNKVRSTYNRDLIYDWGKDLNLGDKGEDGHQLRPHIVWFGEEVPELERAIPHISESDCLIIIGTSLQVYPAAGLSSYARPDIPVYYCDLAPQLNYELQKNKNLEVIAGRASLTVPNLVERIKKES